MQPFDYSPYQQLVCKYVEYTIDVPAYSMFAKTYQYCWHSTNRNRSFCRKNEEVHRSNSKMSEMTGKKKSATSNGWVSKKGDRVKMYPKEKLFSQLDLPQV